METSTDASPPSGVLHVIPHQGVWGVARFVIELSRHERMDGAADEIMLSERALDVDSDFLAPATPVHFLGLTGERTGARGRRLADVAEARGLDTIRIYSGQDLELAAAAKAARGSLLAEACLFDAPPRGSMLAGRRLRRAVRALDRRIAMSPAVAENASALGAPFEAWAPAVDVQRFSPAEATSSWRQARLPNPDTLLVGTLMRVGPGKRQDVLMEAVERRHDSGRPTALLMVGDGPGFGALKEQVSGSDVLFARRRVLDSPGFFHRIDAFALHSDAESVPMGLVEAMSCGCPAVVADAAARGHVAGWAGRDAALFIEPGDVNGLVEALDRLARPDEREPLAAAARARALANHSLGQFRARLRQPAAL